MISKPRIVACALTLALCLLLPSALADSADEKEEMRFSFLGQVGGASQTVALEGHTAYLAKGNQLFLLDVSDASQPKELGVLALPSALYGVFPNGSRVYVAAGFSGLQVLDVTDPAHPRILGSLAPPHPRAAARDVYVRGRYAFVAYAKGGMSVVDVSDPTHPEEVGLNKAIGSVNGITVDGRYAYACTDGGLHVLDISDAAAPVSVANLPTISNFVRDISGYGCFDVDVRDSVALVVDGYGGLVSVDVSKPLLPRTIGWYAVPYDRDVNTYTEADKGFGAAFGLDVVGNHAYLAAFNAGIRIVDVSDPTTLREVGWKITPLWAYEVAVGDGQAFVADYDGGLRILNVSNPNRVDEVGSFNPGGAGSFRGIDVVDNLIYAAVGAGGLLVLDASDPQAIKQVGIIDTPNFSYGVKVDGDVAYVADASSIRLIDVSNPAQMQELGAVVTEGSLRSLNARDGFVYVGAGPTGLVVIDARDPRQPEVVGVCDTPDNARRVSLHGELAYVGDEKGGLRIVDVSDPSNPTEVGFWLESMGPRPPHVWGADVHDGYAYVAESNVGLHVLDVRDPAAPALVKSIKTPSFAWDVVVDGDSVFVGDSFSGLRVYDITDPAEPVESFVYDSPGVAWEVKVRGDRIYVVDGVCGVTMLSRKAAHAAESSARAPGMTVISELSGNETGTRHRYMGSDHVRIVDGDSDRLFDLATGEITLIDHRHRQYDVTSFAALAQGCTRLQEKAAANPDCAAYFDKLGEVSVQAGDETRSIAGRKCREYHLSLGTMVTVDACIAESLDAPPGYFAGMRTDSLVTGPTSARLGQLVAALEELPGLPLSLTVTQLTGFHGRIPQVSGSEVVAVEEGVPGNAFEIPAGYTER